MSFGAEAGAAVKWMRRPNQLRLALRLSLTGVVEEAELPIVIKASFPSQSA